MKCKCGEEMEWNSLSYIWECPKCKRWKQGKTREDL